MPSQFVRGMPILLPINGSEYQIKYPLRLVKELEASHHIRVMAGGEMLGEVLKDPERFAILLSYGLQTKHPECTPDWVMDNVDASMFIDMLPYLAYAITGQRVDIQQALASPNGAGLSSPSTGSNSGQ